VAPLLSGSSVFRVTRCTSLTFSTQFPIPVFRPTSSVSNKWAEPFVSFYAQYQTSSLSPVPLCVGMRGQDFKSQQVLHETFRVMLRRGVSPLLPFVASGKDVAILQDAEFTVLAQREMEKRRSPLLSVPPFGRGFSRHGVFRSDGGWAAQERALTRPRSSSRLAHRDIPRHGSVPAVPASVSPGKIIVTPQRAAVAQHPVCP